MATTTITLPRPITVMGEERTTLSVRPLKLKDLADLNLRLSEQGLTLAAGDLLAAIARAANVPASALGELSIAEGIEVMAACVPFLGLPPDGWERCARELVFGGGVSPREVAEMTATELFWWHRQLVAWASAGRS